MMIYKKSIYLFTLLLTFCLHDSGLCGKIIYPWNATTAIVKSGDSFTIWFDADGGQNITSVELSSPYITVQLSMDPPVVGNWIYDVTSGATYNRRITVFLPVDTPADRYDLILKTSSGDEISISAVKVVRKFKDNYNIVHLSDIHLQDINYRDALLEKRLTAIVNMVNIIDPEIVISTGDNLYWHPTNFQSRVDMFYNGDESVGFKGLHDLNAATFVLVGNHDFEETEDTWSGNYERKARFWNKYHGIQAYNFKYGNGRFMVINNGWNGYDYNYQFNDINNWLSSDGAGGNFRVGLYHKWQFEKIWASQNNLDLALSGHNHHKGNGNPWPLGNRGKIEYVAPSILRYGEFNLFRVNDSDGSYYASGDINTDQNTVGYGLPTGTLNIIENDGEKENPSAWKLNLTLKYDQENDGTLTSNSATIVNKFDFPIKGARVRFLMVKGFEYATQKGNITQAFDGDEVHVVDVNIDLAANSTTIIDITTMQKLDHNILAYKQNSILEKIPTFTTNHSPELVVWNIGKSTEYNVPVYCIISSDGVVEYSSIKTIKKIEPNEVTTVTFDSWNTVKGETYDLMFITALDGDQDKYSDTLYSSIVVDNLFEGFETDFENWVTDASWGIDDRKAYSGEFSMSVNSGPRYENNTNSYSLLNYSFDLTTLSSADFTFQSLVVMASGDSGFVEISTDKGITWEQLGEVHHGLNTEWMHHQYSLQAYNEYSDVRFRFRFVSDSENNHIGWFIDDVKIENIVTSVHDDNTGNIIEGYKLYNNYPNPFNPSTTIRFLITKKEFVKLKVYDVLGEEVAILVNDSKTAGEHSIIFNSRHLPSGIYFYKLNAGKFEQCNKMVLLR